MAPALISQPVLAANPQADTRSYINGLLDELRQCIDNLPVVPGQAVPVDYRKIMELRGTFMDASTAIRNTLKWAM
jgi:hypothetical protein